MDTLEEYRKAFYNDLKENAEAEGTTERPQFINKVLGALEEIGDLNDPYPIDVPVMKGKNNRQMNFDAYAYDEADSALVLIACEFTNRQQGETPTLTKSRIDDLVAHMRNFVDEAVNGDISKYCDDSDVAITIAQEFRAKIGKNMQESDILRFKFYIISDCVISNRVKDISIDDFLERPSSVSIWTIDRLYELGQSASSEIIEFDTSDFEVSGIPVLKAEIGSDVNYDAYMGIMPGKFLADIYLKYGSKLLQGNVRAFLSARGKVNKGIRKTIANEPHNFFTYNNGIAVVARSVTLSYDGRYIVHFKDPQIINGGQTTASLANAIIKKEAYNGMENLYVPMKLTVLNVKDEMSEEDMDKNSQITKTISQCANSQNAVSDADFFSNHPFHIEMEKLSKKNMVPPASGKAYSTIWFYERSRGKWEQEQMKLKPADRKKYIEKHPKSQVVKKEKLAKCYNSILMHPDQVCQSSAINFSKFAKYIEYDIWEKSRDSVNDEFFKKCICSVIIFDNLDKLISKAGWYHQGGDKAQIVPYTISKLISLLPKNKDIDWKYIWQNQSLPQALTNELLRLAEVTQTYMTEKAEGGLVRTKARTPKFWDNFKEFEFSISDEFAESLVDSALIKDAVKSAERTHRFNSVVDRQVEIFKLGAQYWQKVYSDLLNKKMLPYGDINFIKDMTEIIKANNLPTDKQCSRLVKITQKAEDKGYIMP